jgi:ribonuclease HI
MELCPYSLEFQSRTTIKSQALVDFIVEWTDLSVPPDQGLIEYWKMYFDGSLKIDGAGAGVLFISPNKDELRYVLRLHFPTSNNTTEYEACLHGMRIAVELGVKRLYVYDDSALVITSLIKTRTRLARRWMLTARKSESWKASSTASNTRMWSEIKIK